MCVRSGDERLELRRPKAEPVRPHGLVDERLAEVVPRVAPVGQERSVGRERVVGGFAEELPGRLPRRLAADVPERHVDRPERVDQGAAASGHGGGDVEAFPDRGRVERIHADEGLTETQIHRVRTGRLNAGTCDPGVQVGLADAGDPLVGVDLDDDVVLVRAGRRPVIAGIEQDMACDVRDFHGSLPRQSRYRPSSSWKVTLEGAPSASARVSMRPPVSWNSGHHASRGRTHAEVIVARVPL